MQSLSACILEYQACGRFVRVPSAVNIFFLHSQIQSVPLNIYRLENVDMLERASPDVENMVLYSQELPSAALSSHAGSQ